MPKPAITCDLIMTGVNSRADGSLGLRFATRELSAEEKLPFLELLNNELKVLLQPKTLEPIVSKEVKGFLATKSQSERIRGILFVFWKQVGEPGEWEVFYRHETEKIIDQIRLKLKPEPE